jgi:hypothetical protein
MAQAGGTWSDRQKALSTFMPLRIGDGCVCIHCRGGYPWQRGPSMEHLEIRGFRDDRRERFPSHGITSQRSLLRSSRTIVAESVRVHDQQMAVHAP